MKIVIIFHIFFAFFFSHSLRVCTYEPMIFPLVQHFLSHKIRLRDANGFRGIHTYPQSQRTVPSYSPENKKCIQSDYFPFGNILWH